MELGWGGFDRAKLDMLILIRIPFSFHEVVCVQKVLDLYIDTNLMLKVITLSGIFL